MGAGTLALVAAANALVGACVGLTGIAGFLLPMFYAGFLGLAPVEGLALSFAAFIVSGALGCPAYRRTGDLPLRASAGLLAGSFLGALAGTQVGLVLPADVLTVILYLVVLGSGASVLLRMRAGEKDAADVAPMPGAGRLFVVGLVTAVVCAASGAGGPVLVVPVLMLMGVGPRTAVGMALLDSVAIAVPATVGYLLGGGVGAEVWSLLPAALVAHGAGVLLGSFNAHRINAPLLKGIVAVGSIAVALFKLAQLAL